MCADRYDPAPFPYKIEGVVQTTGIAYGLDDDVDAVTIRQTCHQIARFLRGSGQRAIGARKGTTRITRLDHDHCTGASGLRRKAGQLSDCAAADYGHGFAG